MLVLLNLLGIVSVFVGDALEGLSKYERWEGMEILKKKTEERREFEMKFEGRRRCRHLEGVSKVYYDRSIRGLA